MADVMMKCGHVANAVRRVAGRDIPVCAICDGFDRRSEQVDNSAPSLEGRQARCSCGAITPSSVRLAFFEYRGPGSPRSQEQCAHCGFNESVHKEDTNGFVAHAKCPGFTPKGAYEFDSYYCGCAGWD
jgi:hypothetical protein